MKVNTEIEPKIAPLVVVLNATGLVNTFSSCEGHFPLRGTLGQPEYAEVRFDILPNIPESALEEFFFEIDFAFESAFSFDPIRLRIFKYYYRMSPGNSQSHFCLEFVPFDNHYTDAKKRQDTDAAIKGMVKIIEKISAKK